MLQDFLGRLRPESDLQQRFQAWPPAPPLQEIGWGRSLPALGRPEPRQPTRYAPAMVIGLGSTGNLVLRQWLRQVGSSSVEKPVPLRAATLSTQATNDPLPAGPVLARQFVLASASTAAGGPFGVRREAARALIREYANYTPFRDWVQPFVAEHPTGIQAVVVASLVESEVGMLGEVLQLLRQSSLGATNPFLRIIAFLTCETPDPSHALDPAETYAAMREITRFAVNGPHWMEPPPGTPLGIVQTSLLDHLFLIEARGPTPNTLDLRGTPFDQGVGQALAETLFTFLHPASGKLSWNNLRTHEPLVHSLGIAALRVPVGEMQEYVAARLAYAAMYDEPRHYRAEGMVFRGQGRVPPDHEDAALARRWLERGPCAHPLFPWLLDEVNSPNSFRVVPSLTTEFEAAFQAQVVHGLIALLNSASDVDVLGQSRIALNWLAKWIARLTGWIGAVSGTAPCRSEREALKKLFEEWAKTVTYLKQQIGAWEAALFETGPVRDLPHLPPPTDTASLADWRTTGTGIPGASGGVSSEWRATPLATAAERPQSSRAISADWRSETVPQTDPHASLPGVPVPKTLLETLRQYQEAAEAALIAASGGQISRALTAGKPNDLAEADAYYADGVRPELKQFGRGVSENFSRVRNRLGWWVLLTPAQQPELFLICLPPEHAVEEKATPPQQARYKPGEVDRLGQALLSVARTQTLHLAADLTGNWFRQRLDQMEGFLERATYPLLHYDQDAAAARPQGITRHAYLFARDKTLAGRYRTAAFPTMPPDAITEVVSGEEGRITALSLWLSVPLATIVSLSHAYARYRLRATLHLYPQEQTAARYESLVHAQTGEWVELPPDFLPVLAHPRLVTLFFQSLIGGLIEPALDPEKHARRWMLRPVNENYEPVPLADEGPLDLWQALRHFALELPNQPAETRRPTDHFHRDRREGFTESLTTAVRERLRQQEIRAHRENTRRTLLTEWQRRGERDHLARAFARLLEVELDGPAWPGFWD